MQAGTCAPPYGLSRLEGAESLDQGVNDETLEKLEKEQGHDG